MFENETKGQREMLERIGGRNVAVENVLDICFCEYCMHDFRHLKLFFYFSDGS